MDRNTIIGLVLIGGILAGFTFFNQPSEEEIKAQKEKEKKELAEKQKKDDSKKENKESSDEKAETKEASQTVSTESAWVLKLDESGEPVAADSGYVVYTDTFAKVDSTFAIADAPGAQKQNSKKTNEVKGELIRMENEKFIIDFTTKGGQVASVRLKEYETFKDYAKKDGKITPLLLFKEGDARNSLVIPSKDGEIQTENVLFDIKEQTDSTITFAYTKNGGTVEFKYTIKADKYDLDYDITLRGFSGKVTPQNVMLNWDVAYRKTERIFSEQRRVSTVCFNYKDEGFSYLTEMGDDEEEAEDHVDWVNFKQSYFSMFMNPETPFNKEGTSFEVFTYPSGHERQWSNIKDFKSTLNLNLKSVDNYTTRINWYFGPNDFKVLKSYDQDYDRILNYGWGLFRWINLYVIQPLFSFIKATGWNIGIVILIVTLIIKFGLMPIQWKMYTSSAKMRILKPQIAEINKKYPGKEDAMKKQMEMMSLYRETGASPFSGCVPMLIQMPILLAVFRFFPATFDLRQKSFLWADDLSSYDSIYDFGFNVWFYGDHISLFTLLMAATTLIYTFINSSNMQQPDQPGMPNMKVIMYIFPVMMIFFFNNYASGLSYYYFISTLTSILIMVMIKRFFVDEEKLKAKMANRQAAKTADPKTKKKSKFQERLEQMQKAQMEQAKNKKNK